MEKVPVTKIFKTSLHYVKVFEESPERKGEDRFGFKAFCFVWLVW